MARGLYEAEPAFREGVDACARLLAPQLELDLRAVIHPAPEEAEETGRRLEELAVGQCVLFTIEYALARTWMAWGVRPQAMLGHSAGEYVAACLAGVMSLEDALALVLARGRLMQPLEGAMLSVQLSSEELQPHLGPELAISAANAPAFTTVAGSLAAVEALEAKLE